MKAQIALFVISALAVMQLMAASTAAPVIGSVAPDWRLDNAAGERIVFDASARDKPAVLIFWATWCPYCRALMPHLQELQNSLPADAVDFYALNIFEDGDPAAYLARKQYQFMLLPEADDIAKIYSVAGTPGVFLVDAKGIVRYLRTQGTKPRDVAASIRAALEK